MKISNNVIAVLIVLFMISSIYANYTIVKEGDRQIRMQEISGKAASAEVSICINHAPYIEPVPPQNATVGEYFELQINATDADNDALRYFDDTGLFDIHERDGIIQYTPELGDVSETPYSIKIDVYDPHGCVSSHASITFSLTIYPPARKWINITPPEGIFEPSSALSGTHVNLFSIRFINATIIESDTLSCKIKQADSSTLTVSATNLLLDQQDYSLNYTVTNSDSIINDPAVGYMPWILKNCTLRGSSGNLVYNRTIISRIYVHDATYWEDNEITRAVSCITAPEVYFNNTAHCEFLEDALFALQMRNGNPVNESCFNNPGIACGDPYCNGIYFPTCDPLSYFGGYSALSDDPNNIGSFTASVGSYSTPVWYTVYTNTSGSLKVRVRETLADKTFSIAITNLTNISTNSNVYGENLGGGSLSVDDQGDGTWALTHKRLADGFTGTLDFTFNVSFTDQNLNENRTVSIIIAYGTETNAGSPETFEIALDPILGPSNRDESQNTSIMVYGPVCGDGANNDFDYIGGTWAYSYDCFDDDCDGTAGANQTNEFGSGKTGLCNYAAETNCTDEYDNDYDYISGTDYTDCHDSDCFNIDTACPATETICNDNINNDWDYTDTENDTADKIGNNGTKYGGDYIYDLTDCEDPDCNSSQGGASGQLCSWGYETNCSDGFDNDALQLKDCELGIPVNSITNPDYDAHAEYDCASYCRGTGTNNNTETGAECDDGIDNDWDLYKVDDYYNGSINNSNGAGIDCRWTDYNPDEDCNMTILSSGFRCELQFELNCSDGFDNDFDSNYSSMPHAGWSADSSGYLTYFGTTYANDADYDDYDCKVGPLAPINESINVSWCFDGIDNDLDRYYWNGATYAENTSTGYDCYDPDCEGVVNPNNLSQACIDQEYNATDPFFMSLTYPGMYCENSLDDDVDGPIDCADSDCNKQFDRCTLEMLTSPCYDNESVLWDSCKDSIDNDYDNSSDGIDCSDSDCIGMIGADSGALCEDMQETLCYDGFDNDGDGDADCDDSNCNDQIGGKINNISVYCRTNENTLADCFDGFDNDADNYIDCYDTSCNTQCNLSTISGTTPITLPDWNGSANLKGITEAYVEDYTRRIRKDEWYNITFRMTSASTRAQWTIGAATGYGQFPVYAFNESTAYLAGPNSNNFSLTQTSNGFIVDSDGADLPSGYTVSFLIKSSVTLNVTGYELTYAENTGYKTSINNQIYVEIVEEIPPEAQLIQVIPYSGNLSYGGTVYLRANISDNNQLGLCDWYVYGQATFDPADSRYCRGSFSPTEEGTYYINVTPVDYYSNRGTPITTIYNLNILPASSSVTTIKINRSVLYFRSNETVIFNASFNVPSTDTLGTCQLIVKDEYDNETILASFTATGNDCYVNNVAVSSLSDGLYRVFARVIETTESNIIESNTTPLFVCSQVRTGICQLVDFNENSRADVCEANFGPNITGWYPISDPTITEEQNQTFNITFEDPNNDNIRIRWFVDGAPVEVHYDNIRWASNYTFVSDYLSAGEYNIAATIDDGEFFVSHEWLLNVTNVNRLPYFIAIIPNQTWNEDTSLMAFDLDDYAYDPDTDDNISYSYKFTYVVHSPIVATIDPITHMVTFSQPGNWFGNDSIYFIIDDGEGGTNRSNDVHLEVRNMPEPVPEPAPPPKPSKPCRSQWYCKPWGMCHPNGTRYRECIDLMECAFRISPPVMEERCIYMPTCYDGIKNLDEDDIDCGGPCPPCWTCFDMIQNCHVVEGRIICEEGIDCGGPCPACPSCFDGIENQDEVGIDCGGPCLADCCENGYRDIGLGEVGVDCGGPCPSCPVVRPAPPPISRIRQILTWLLILILIALLITLIMKNRERILEAIYKMRLKKEVVVEEDTRGTMLNKLIELERTIPRKTKEELTRDVSTTFKELLKKALGIKYEFTHEELMKELKEAKIEPGLREIIKSFSEDMSKVKYSGYKLTKEESKSLLNEMKAITHLSTKKIGEIKIAKEVKPTPKNKVEEFSYNISEAFGALVEDNISKVEELYHKASKLKKGLEPEEKGMLESQIKRLEKAIKVSKKRIKVAKAKEAAAKTATAVTGLLVIALVYLFINPGITGLYTAEPIESSAFSSVQELHLEIGQEFSHRIYYDDPDRENVVFSDDTRLFSIDKDGLLIFTPTEDMQGIHYVAIIAKDGTGWYDVKIVKLVIGEVTELSVEPGTVGNLTDLEYERIAVENFANQTINEKSNLTNLTD